MDSAQGELSNAESGDCYLCSVDPTDATVKAPIRNFAESFPTDFNGKVFVFKVYIPESDPQIWRRLHMSSLLTFADLGDMIERAMGWSGRAWHKFFVRLPTNRKIVEMVSPCVLAEPWQTDRDDQNDESKAKLADYFNYKNPMAYYAYDVANEWDHNIELENVLETEDGRNDIKHSVEGEGLCPPEQCQGIKDFYRIVKILKDQQHKEHNKTKTWLMDNHTNGEKLFEAFVSGVHHKFDDLLPVNIQ